MSKVDAAGGSDPIARIRAGNVGQRGRPDAVAAGRRRRTDGRDAVATVTSGATDQVPPRWTALRQASRLKVGADGSSGSQTFTPTRAHTPVPAVHTAPRSNHAPPSSETKL